ncbi:MAG: hypothetical protein AB4041_21980 [Microcystaceae cyanobacterium]
MKLPTTYVKIRNQQMLGETQQLHGKHDSSIGALGSHWGLYSENG